MIQIQCPQCAKHYRVKEEAVGSEVRCPNCQTMILIEPVAADGEPQTPPPFDASVGGAGHGTATATYPGSLEQAAGPRQTSGMAITALVLGILSFCVPLLGIVPMVLGITAMNRIDNPANRLAGRGMALAGAILGGIGLVVSIVLVVIALLLPALGPPHRAARMMQNNTQLRGIHQGMVTFAQGNNSNFPGITASNVIFDGSNLDLPNDQQDGGSVEVRYQLMLEGNYFTGAYAISPAETKFDWGQGGSLVTSDNYSYSMLQIHSSSGGAGNDPDRVGRSREWTESLNTEAVVMSDRTLDPHQYYSVWTQPSYGGHDWRGGVVRNDNSTSTENSHLQQTRYASGLRNIDDDLFADPPGAANEVPAYSNALMIYAGHDTVEGW